MAVNSKTDQFVRPHALKWVVFSRLEELSVLRSSAIGYLRMVDPASGVLQKNLSSHWSLGAIFFLTILLQAIVSYAQWGRRVGKREEEKLESD